MSKVVFFVTEGQLTALRIAEKKASKPWDRGCTDNLIERGFVKATGKGWPQKVELTSRGKALMEILSASLKGSAPASSAAARRGR